MLFEEDGEFHFNITIVSGDGTVTAVSILFADELFRLRYVFRIQDVDLIEPTVWELAGRYISWTVITVTVLVVYIMGLL